MKNTKILLALLLLAITATTTSCLSDDDDKTYTMDGYFTIAGTGFNYTLYRDGGGVVTPSASSVSAITDNKGFGDKKRAYLYLTYKEANYSVNEKNEIKLDQAELQSGFYLDTKNIISKEEADRASITLKDSIFAIKVFDNVWADNGYVTAAISAYYDVKSGKGIDPDINMVFSPEDIKENAIKFHIYYNRHNVPDTTPYGPYTFVKTFPLTPFINMIPGSGDIEMTFEVDGGPTSKTIKVSRDKLKTPVSTVLF